MSERRGLCSNCLQSFPAEELTESSGKQYCQSCMPLVARRFKAPVDEFTKKNEKDGHSIPSEMDNPQLQIPQGFWDYQLYSISQSCTGKLWLVRIPFIVYFAYALCMYWYDSGGYMYPRRYFDIFKPLNLGIHEWGHFVFRPFGEFLMVAGGSLLQCLAPIGAAVMFYRNRDYFGVVFCSAWLGVNLFDVAIYLVDAGHRILPLVTPGGGVAKHDWVYLLNRMGLFSHPHEVGFLVRLVATACILFFLVSGSWLLYVMYKNPKVKRV